MRKLQTLAFPILIMCALSSLCAAPFGNETPDAAGVALWVKNLPPINSPDTVLDTLNAFDIHKALDLGDWEAVHNAGMPGFYNDPALSGAVIAKLKKELLLRAQIMATARGWFNRNVIGEAFWDMVEPVKGSYHIQITDEILFAAQFSGAKPLVLVTPLSSWDQMDGKYKSDPPFSDPLGNLFMLSPAVKGLGPVVDLNAYGDFLSKLKQRTGPAYFEIGNEVDGGPGATYRGEAGAKKYIKLLAVSKTALGTGSTILNAGALGFSGKPPSDMDGFWQTFFSQGGVKSIDVLNLHYLMELDKTAADSSGLGSMLNYFNELMNASGDVRPIWITEIPFGDAALSERQTAGVTLRRFAYAAARGVRKFFIEFAEDRLPGGGPLQGLSGLARSAMMHRELNGDYVARLMFYSHRLINHKLSGFTDCMELAADEQYRFIVKGKSVYVLRGDRPIPAELRGKHVRITDIAGFEEFPILPTDPVPVSLIARGNEIPVFVELY